MSLPSPAQASHPASNAIRRPRRSSPRAFIWLFFLLSSSIAGLAQLSDTLHIVAVERLPGDQLRLVFQETGATPLDYRLTQRFSLDTGATNFLDLAARIVDLGDGLYHTIISRPPESPRFFRIAGFTGGDSDGDGLSDALEAWVGTRSDAFDTDEDGFGDGVELERGADPLNRDSRPMIVRAEFALDDSAAREGDGSASLIVNFNTSFQGTLLYRIADMSTAVSGMDFAPISGSVTVNGPSASIPVTLLDDTNVEPTKLLIVDLLENAWEPYQIGGISRHVLRLLDNDAYWSGVMGTTNAAQLGFRLRLLRVGEEVVSAALVSELSTNVCQGVGTIPVGVWPVQSTLTANAFAAVVDPIPMGTSLLTGDLTLQRLLTFTADAGNPHHLVRSNLIVGTFTDRLQSTDPAMSWVGGNIGGVVVLMEDLPAGMPRTSPPDVRATGKSSEGGGQ